MAENRFNISKFVGPSEYPEYSDIPSDVPEIKAPSQELASKIFELVSEAAEGGEFMGLRGGHAYRRHGYLCVDTLGGPRNPSYGSSDDDVVLQITVQVSESDAREIVALASEEAAVRAEAALRAEEAALEAQRQSIDAQIADLQARREGL